MSKVEIKALIHESGLKCWQVAEKWGISEGNFSRKLRKPFSDAEVVKLKNIISELKTEQEAGAVV